MVTEFPSAEDLSRGELLSGFIGEQFDAALEGAKLGRDYLFIIAAVQCAPTFPLKDKELKKAARCCRERLLKYVRLARPGGKKPMLVMGQVSALGLTDKWEPVGPFRGFVEEG